MDADAAVKLVQKAGNKEFKEVKEFKEKTNDCTPVRLMWTLTRLSSWCRRQAIRSLRKLRNLRKKQMTAPETG